MNDTIEIVIILAVTFVAIPLLIVFVRNILRLCKKNEYEIDLHEIQLGKTPSTDRKTSRLKYNEYSYNISRIKVFTPIGKFSFTIMLIIKDSRCTWLHQNSVTFGYEIFVNMNS